MMLELYGTPSYRYNICTGEIDNDSRVRVQTFPVRVSENGRFATGFNMD